LLGAIEVTKYLAGGAEKLAEALDM